MPRGEKIIDMHLQPTNYCRYLLLFIMLYCNFLHAVFMIYCEPIGIYGVETGCRCLRSLILFNEESSMELFVDDQQVGYKKIRSACLCGQRPFCFIYSFFFFYEIR